MEESGPKKGYKVFVWGLLLIIGVGIFTVWRNWETLHPVTVPVTSDDQDKEASFPTIEPAELQTALFSVSETKPLVIDIRSPEEYEREHIFESKHIPLDRLASLSPEPSQQTFIVMGNGLQRDNLATEAATLLKRQGKGTVKVLKGGFQAWKKNFGPTISSGDPQSFVDQSKVRYKEAEAVKNLLDIKPQAAASLGVAQPTPFVLDVRTEGRFRASHLPGAINIPLEQLERRFRELPGGRTIIVYGETELESFQAGVRLFDLNVFLVDILKGGFSTWQEKKFPVVEEVEK